MSALRRLDENLWVAERPLKLIVGDVGTRMTIIRLHDGSLFLHSPVRLDDATRQALGALGEVRHVVAPSKVHHLFVGDYRAFAHATLYAAPGLAEKRRAVQFDAVLSDSAPAAWQNEIEQHVFGGIPRVNEVVFLHRASRTLILTDLAFNVSRDRLGGARLFYWLAGAAGRFGPHRLMRSLVRDRGAARLSVERILQWDFDRVIVTHGDVLESGGKEKLRAAFEFLG